MVQIYAAVNACGITLLELGIITGFKWIKTMMLPRGYIPTHTACADILLLPFSLHILRAVTADSTYAIFARKNNVSAKGEMEACSQDREKGKTDEPCWCRSFACLSPTDSSSTLWTLTGWSTFSRISSLISQHCTNEDTIRGSSTKQPEKVRR